MDIDGRRRPSDTAFSEVSDSDDAADNPADNPASDILLQLDDVHAAAVLTRRLALIAPQLAVCMSADLHRRHPPGTTPALRITDTIGDGEPVTGEPFTILIDAANAARGSTGSPPTTSGGRCSTPPTRCCCRSPCRHVYAPPPAAPTDANTPPTVRLSNRERQILTAISTGQTNTEIARRLGISLETVKTHIRRVYRTLGATDRGHAVALAFLGGQIDVNRVADAALTPRPHSSS